MITLGLRHIALRVRDVRVSKAFYSAFFGMTIDWEPDPKNVYLTSAGHDNLALHEVAGLPPSRADQPLDHLGFFACSPQDVEVFHAEAVRKGIPIVHPPKKHRDGSTSFYLKDPDGNTVQVIHHPHLK